MWRHLIIVSTRNLLKNRVYSLINIIGLSLALTCAILVTLFIKDELSYDRFHERSSQLYRVTTTITKKDGSIEQVGSTGQIQGPAFKSALPEIADYVRLMSVDFNVATETKALSLKGLFADHGF